MAPIERLARIHLLSGEAFETEALVDHIVRVAETRDADGDAYTADALRIMARVYRARADTIRNDIASLAATHGQRWIFST